MKKESLRISDKSWHKLIYIGLPYILSKKLIRISIDYQQETAEYKLTTK